MNTQHKSEKHKLSETIGFRVSPEDMKILDQLFTDLVNKEKRIIKPAEFWRRFIRTHQDYQEINSEQSENKE